MLTPERWAAVERIFHEALTCPEASRAAFLESSCGDDLELRREIESLLKADSDARSRLSLAPRVAAEWAAATGSPIGRDVDSYRVVSLLGAGGMGEVFLAEDRSLGRRVALKLLPIPFAGDAARLRRFTEEARAASALNHPNIITVHQVGDFEGRRYIATEFIDGETLRDRMSRGPLRVPEALDIALQVARALDAAHAAGIVHRDIKPENIMIRHDGYVKVLDFGLAKLAADERLVDRGIQGATPPAVTRAGAVLGTLHYMAPEQAAGAAVDARADLYSLAVVMHEMLTGALPAAEAGAAGARASRLPRRLERFLQRGLEADPAARFASAGVFAAELERIRRSEAEPSSAARSSRRIAAAAAAAAIAILAVVVWVRGQPSVPAVGSVAVLPFSVLDGVQTDQSHLTFGMTEALAARLEEARQLRVTPSGTVRHFVGSSRAPTDIGRELGVAAVVAGSLLRAGDRLQVTAQVLRVSDGERLWTGRFDEPFADIFLVQDRAAREIISALSLDVDAGALSRVRHRETRHADAYDLYARAREQWARRTPDAIRRAIGLFERALALDPDFPLAYAGLANAYALTASGLLPAERFPKAKAAALHALALDDTLAEAHNALAFISYKWEWQWAQADERFRRAIALQPNYALAHHWYSEFLSIIGRHEEALAGLAEARSLDPYSTAIRVDRAAALVRASRAEDAVALLQAAIAETPQVAALHRGLSNAYWALGRPDEAFEALVQSRVLAGATDTRIEDTRRVYRAGGLDAVLRDDLVQLHEVDRTGRSQGYFSRLSIAASIAHHYAVLGERDRALTWLEESVRRRDDGPLTMTMWYWKPFRNDPRFQAIARQVGMP